MKKQNKKIQIEFDSEHLHVLINALETYSRLQSGQVSIAMDTVYADRNLSWDEREYIEKVVRYVAFPSNPRRNYDGHGGFYDQYNNEYDEGGTIVKESEEWYQKKNRPHLDHSNSSFGVGCTEMKNGTIAWEIKKAIEEYLHYQRNGGYRDMGVDGDGVMNISGVPNAKILNPVFYGGSTYWKPQKEFKIPQRYQEEMRIILKDKRFDDAWKIVDKSFKNKPLPKGSATRIVEKSDTYYVVVEKPIKNL